MALEKKEMGKKSSVLFLHTVVLVDCGTERAPGSELELGGWEDPPES